jgi:small subunit ribosomal protein S10e
MPNLEVMKLLQSFASKGYVTEVYNWRWFYYYLTEKGITYLRQYLGIPDDIVPNTLKVTAQTAPTRPRFENDKSKGTGPGGDFQPRFQREGGREGGREGYRRPGGFGRSAGGGAPADAAGTATW